MTRHSIAILILAACGSNAPQSVDASAVVTDTPAHDATSPRDAACALGPEDTVAACTDGCDNDGDGHLDKDDYDCCGVVEGASCPAGKNVCPGVASTWNPGTLSGSTTYHEVATATATFAATAWIWQCTGTPSPVTIQMTPPAPGVRQLLFHIVVPADAPARTTLALQPSLTTNVRYWTMAGACGASIACVEPPQTFGSAGTVMGSLVPGTEIYYVLESDNSSTDPVTLALDLTNQ